MKLLLFIFILTQLYKPSTQRDKGVNLALGKPTFQSSTILDGVSSNAVDGYRHPDYSQLSCINTGHTYEPWWYVNLETVYYVTTVVISNRGDCCHDRLAGFRITVGYSNEDAGINSKQCVTKYTNTVGPGESVELTCAEPLDGRYVTVVIPGEVGTLNFCEVEVYGRKTSNVNKFKLVSYGFGETASTGKPYSYFTINNKRYGYDTKGLNFKLINIETGGSALSRRFDTHSDSSCATKFASYFKSIPNNPGYIITMVLYQSGEKYYHNALPYMEDYLGQSIPGDLSWGDTWVFLGYYGHHNPVPHWRQSVRQKAGSGPATIATLIPYRVAPSGIPVAITVAYLSGSSLTVTWQRPNEDLMTDHDFYFDYKLCIIPTTFCDVVVKQYYYTFNDLKALTEYTVTIQAQVDDLVGPTAQLKVTTIEQDSKFMKVKLISRVMEDSLYRVYGQLYSTIIISGFVYNFEKHGHHFVIADVITGKVLQTASFDTHEYPRSGSDMISFITSLPNKVIIFMVVYYRGHTYYQDAVTTLNTLCPHTPRSLQADQSNAVICYKGIGQPQWGQSNISTFSNGPAIIDKDIFLPKYLTLSPTFESSVASHDNITVTWSAPITDKYTGTINHYEICYDGDFNSNGCDKINSDHLDHTIINLHAWTKYDLKIRAATFFDCGPYSSTINVQTLETAPSGPPESISVDNVNATFMHVSWALPAKHHRNGDITQYEVCVRFQSQRDMCLQRHTTDQKDVVLTGLYPFTDYVIEVKARTASGFGPAGSIAQKTNTAVPYGPPISPRFQSINSTSFTIQWSPPEYELRNGIIENYNICIRQVIPYHNCHPTIVPGTQRQLTIPKLKPFTVYDVIIAAATFVGYGPSILATNKTSESAPSRPAQSFKVTNINSSTISLTWLPPDMEYRHGIISKYTISIKPLTAPYLTTTMVVVGGNVTSYMVMDLKPYVMYAFGLRAGTVAGFGPECFTNATTLMTAPSGPPTYVVASNITSTTFHITWLPPVIPDRNGIITSYKLCIREFGVSYACNNTYHTSGTQGDFVFTGLEQVKEYLVEIKAATKIGHGPSAFVQKMAGQCDNPLIDDPEKIRDSQFSASGYLNEGHEPYQARFSGLQLWCNKGDNNYLEIDIGAELRILAIASQGDMRHFRSWVKTYHVMYRSNISGTWSNMTVLGNDVITGNNGEGVVKHYLDEPVLGRYVRFVILSFFGKYCCMRVEIFGCTPAVSPKAAVIESWNATSITVSWQSSPNADKNGEALGYIICTSELYQQLCVNNATYTGRNTQQLVVTGLKPYMVYNIAISYYNIAGNGPPITIEQRTAQDAPSGGPEVIEVLETTPSSMKIFWRGIVEEEKNGVIINYAICWLDINVEQNCTSYHQLPVSPRTFVMKDLNAFTEYKIFVKGATKIGWGPYTSHIHRTLSAPPSAPPTAVAIQYIGSSVLQLSWAPPSLEKQNGVIESYRLCAQKITENKICHRNIIVDGTDRNHAISGLKPYTEYIVTIAAGTSGGYGPTSELHQQTGQSVPSGAPLDLVIVHVNTTAITIQWDLPAETGHNGIIISHLLLLYQQFDDGRSMIEVFRHTVPSSTLQWTFVNLQIKTEYIIEVHSGTTQGFGPPSMLHQRTTGWADVTYIKKSNKAYVLLAQAGIAAGALSVLCVLGFILFLFLLLMGHIPRTKPWQKRRKELWRLKIQKQNEKRERKKRQEDSDEFHSTESDSEESIESDSSLSIDEDSTDSEATEAAKRQRQLKKELKLKVKERKERRKAAKAEKKRLKQERKEQKKLAKAKKKGKKASKKSVTRHPSVDMYNSRKEDILNSRIGKKIAAREVDYRGQPVVTEDRNDVPRDKMEHTRHFRTHDMMDYRGQPVVTKDHYGGHRVTHNQMEHTRQSRANKGMDYRGQEVTTWDHYDIHMKPQNKIEDSRQSRTQDLTDYRGQPVVSGNQHGPQGIQAAPYRSRPLEYYGQTRPQTAPGAARVSTGTAGVPEVQQATHWDIYSHGVEMSTPYHTNEPQQDIYDTQVIYGYGGMLEDPYGTNMDFTQGTMEDIYGSKPEDMINMFMSMAQSQFADDGNHGNPNDN